MRDKLKRKRHRKIRKNTNVIRLVTPLIKCVRNDDKLYAFYFFVQNQFVFKFGNLKLLPIIPVYL
jgi:hypothetical protein